MGLAAILVMWPRCRKQTFFPPTQGGSTEYLTLIGHAVSEEKTFEIVEGWQTDGRQTMGIL